MDFLVFRFFAYREVCIRHPSASIRGGGTSMGLTTEEQGGPREESVLEKRASKYYDCLRRKHRDPP